MTDPGDRSDRTPAPSHSSRTLVLAVVAAALILLVVAFLPDVARRLGIGGGPVGGPARDDPSPLDPIPAPGPPPAGPAIPGAPAAADAPPVPAAPQSVRVLDADDRTPVPGASVELRVFGPEPGGEDQPAGVDPASVAPHLRDITERRNQAARRDARPRLYHRSLPTGVDGVAQFPGVPAGAAELITTEREDRVSVWSADQHAIGPPGDPRPEITVLLHRATGRITGRVIDDTGAPKPGAEILVVRNRPPFVDSRAYAVARRDPYHRAMSGADGRFEMPDIPVGAQYIVHARLPGWGAASSASVAVERASASAVTLVLRRDRVITGRVTSTLRPADLSAAKLVAYRVQDPTWRPGDSLNVSYQRGFPIAPDPQGRYEMEAPNTLRYVVIEATLPGHEPVRVAVDFGEGAMLPAQEHDVTFARAGRSLSGRVTDSTGKPVQATITFVSEAESIQQPAIETDALGRFAADWLADAAYTVVAEPHGDHAGHQPGIVGAIRPDRHDLELVCKP